MANRTKIKAMATQLGFGTITNSQLKELNIGNLDYLEHILGQELESRKQNAIAKVKKFCNLPNIKFGKDRLNRGLQYQVEKLLGGEWVNRSENLLIIGACNTGKTALAVYLTSNAIEKGLKAFYIKQEELLTVVKQNEVLPKVSAIFNKIRNADLLVLDEVLYLNISPENLELLYKTVMFINDTTSIVFITNREISEWLKFNEDKYTIRLLIDRALSNAETVRL